MPDHAPAVQVEVDARAGLPLALALRKASSRFVHPGGPDRPAVRKIEMRMARWLRRFLSSQAEPMADQVAAIYAGRAESTGKASVPGARRIRPGTSPVLPSDPAVAAQMLDLLDFAGWQAAIPGGVGEHLVGVAVMTSEATLEALGVTDEAMAALSRRLATTWAYERSAELVGMRLLPDGRVIQNPNARWAITESTRGMLRGSVERALADGWSPDRLRADILDSTAFDGARARAVARTELAFADSEGTMRGYRLSGLVRAKRWVTAHDDKVSDMCRTCEAQGTIALDERFVTGRDAPPNHPNCRCVVTPILEGEPDDVD